jgi:S1-C subfamily serine protease
MSAQPGNPNSVPPYPPILVWIPFLIVVIAGFFLVRFRMAEVPVDETNPSPRSAPAFPLRAETPTVEKEPARLVQATESVLPSVAERTVSPRRSLTPEEQATIALFERASKSVVFIATSEYIRNRLGFDLGELPQGTGSGIIWDDQGHIVTNFHVVENANRCKVILADRTQADAELVGIEPSKDLAVLKINVSKEELVPITVGTSSDLVVGQSVLAIGNPFGFDQTLTTGIISGLDRQISSRNNRRIKGVIQTDAAINPGNSGGPLLDSSGRLIGVNTAIYSPSGAYAGIGFAIPVDIVNNVVPQLIAYGKTIRPVLGIQMLSSTRDLGVQGVLVLEVEPEGTAALAGVEPTKIVGDSDYQLGDIIVQLDDDEIRSPNDIMDFLNGKKVGDEITIKVLRGADTRQPRVVTLTAKLKGTDDF